LVGVQTLQWVEQGRATVDIVVGAGSAFMSRVLTGEMRTLADALVPVVDDLRWDGGSEMAAPSGPSRRGVEPVLSGTLAGVKWVVAANGDDLRLLVGAEAHDTGGLGQTTPEPENFAPYALNPIGVPGGVLLFGRAPEVVDRVRLELSTSAVELPAIGYHPGAVAFAVPLADELDPVAAHLLAADGTTLATIALDELPPYLGDWIGSGVAIPSG
jgi:hypothetical protein